MATMTDDERKAMRAESREMAADWAAGGERARARMSANILRGFEAFPDVEKRALELNLPGDPMTWDEDQWARALGMPSKGAAA